MNNYSHSLLRYVKHNSIDKIKWDEVVGRSANSRVYAFSWFLDRVSEDWDALIWGDYEYVMPLTRRRKWGIKYLFPPMFCQQLGIFPVPPRQIQIEFSNRIRKLFRFIQIQVNSQMDIKAFSGLTVIPKVNFVLPLIEPYSIIASNYSKDRKKNLSITRKSRVTISMGMNASDYSYHKRMALNATKQGSTYQILETLISYTHSIGKGFILNAYSMHNELCAAAFFIRSGNRVVYLNSFSTVEGRKTSAMTAIIDRVIIDYAGSGLLLDFEGSSIPGIAAFMKGFGAHTETYFQLNYNRLPLPLRWLKR